MSEAPAVTSLTPKDSYREGKEKECWQWGIIVFENIYNHLESGKVENSQNLLDKAWQPDGDCFRAELPAWSFLCQSSWAVYSETERDEEPQGFIASS